MKVLLTGSTGYIGRRLLPDLVHAGHHVICPVRDKRRFDFEDFDADFLKNVEVYTVDFLDKASLEKLPLDIDASYYLLHSLSSSSKDFDSLEILSAKNFNQYIQQTTAQQTIYLGGIANDENLSKHLSSRQNVESILAETNVPLTVLRSAIIIGSGGSSFEIIRDLVEKLPIMIAPKWLNVRCQPIAVANVLEYLVKCLGNEKTFNKTFDIGGKDILTYKEMLLQFAKVRKLKRLILTVPILSLKLSSLWLYLVTSTSHKLARNLVYSMKNEVIANTESIEKIISIHLIGYKESLERTFRKINQKQIISSWKDSFSDSTYNDLFIKQYEAPNFGCLKDKRTILFKRNREEVVQNIWEIGGDRGWYYGNLLWRIRGILDKVVGGVGLRRGRRSPNDLKNGDALDFWRVLYANKEEGRLLLFAEMKLPGEAWLEFKVSSKNNSNTLTQTATFRPLGIWGRMYWWLVTPFHAFIFQNMAKNITNYQ